MDELPGNEELSKYNKYILDKIIPGFVISTEFNIYELVRESVSYKCILPSQNGLIMDTYYTIKEHLLTNEFVVEKKEMTSYFLTGKGIELKAAGSIEKFEERVSKKNKKSLFHTLFSKETYKFKNAPVNNGLAEIYE